MNLAKTHPKKKTEKPSGALTTVNFREVFHFAPVLALYLLLCFVCCWFVNLFYQPALVFFLFESCEFGSCVARSIVCLYIDLSLLLMK